METEFVFETEYEQKEMTVMARTLRKTLRRGRNRRSRISEWEYDKIKLLAETLKIQTLPSG